MFWDDLEVHTGVEGFCEFSRLPISRGCYCRHFWSVFKVDRKVDRSSRVGTFLELRY